MLAAQPVANLGQQRIAADTRQVVVADAGRIEAAARRPAGDGSDPLPPAPRQQRGLGHHLVDAVEHHIGRRQQRAGVVGRDELLDAVDPAVRVDRDDALGHRQHLGATIGIAQRMDLAVGVALGNVVEVDQRQVPDRAARQRLGCPRAHAADADHDHVGGAETRHRLGAVQSRHAGKAARWIGTVVGLGRSWRGTRRPLGQRRAGRC